MTIASAEEHEREADLEELRPLERLIHDGRDGQGNPRGDEHAARDERDVRRRRSGT